VEREYSRQLAHRRLEQELGRQEAAEELSEGEKDQQPDAAGAEAANGDQKHHQSRLARISSEARIVSDDEDEGAKDERNLYIVLIRYTNQSDQSLSNGSLVNNLGFASRCSLHGLVRGENMELGRDSDTGGQVSLHSHILPLFALNFVNTGPSCSKFDSRFPRM
jgi:sucrose-phosphate synthase